MHGDPCPPPIPLRGSVSLPSLRLKTKLQLSLVLIASLAIIITGWQAYRNARTALEHATFQRLTALRESRRQEVEQYYSGIRRDILTASADRAIIDASRRLRSAGHVLRTAPELREALVARATRTDASKVPARTDFRNYLLRLAEMDSLFAPFVARRGYDDVMLVDADNGDILYTAKRAATFGSNLRRGPFSESRLAEAFRNARAESNAGRACLVDYDAHVSFTNVPVSFAAAPILNDDTAGMVLIFQISIEEINALMTDHGRWQHDILGESGETYIVGADRRMRNDSRFFIEEPERYLEQIAHQGYDPDVLDAIRAQHTSVMLQEVPTDAATAALNGETDTRIVRDYRGVRVLSSFTPLNIPDLHWVLLAEIDELEAFQSVYRLREQLILSGLILMLFAVILGFIISGTMTRPIQALTRVSEQFGRGDFRRRAEISSDDEIGLLSTTFNTMAEKITSHTRQLEEEIRERRLAEERLQNSRQQLRNLSQHLQGAREEERKSIAREIHDDLGQRLTLHKLQLTLLQDDLAAVNTSLGERCMVMTRDVDATIQSVKRIISQLRPGVLDDLGLTAAIEWQTEEFQRHTGIACLSRITPPEITLDTERSTALFRIFQETLTNVARHANATRVNITLTADANGTTLEIADNGCGISDTAVEQPSSFGLMGMRERASYFGGSIRFSGIPGEGTRVTVHFPQTAVDMIS